MSTPITGLTNLGTPQPTMLLYAALSPFGVTDDRKITANALLSTITANISDVSLQFDNGQATATVSAAGKGKIRYNNLTGTFQQSINGAAYVDIGGGGAGTPGAPLNSVQFNAGAGVFGGNAGFLYTPAANPNALLTATGDGFQALRVVNSATPSIAQIEFRNPANTRRMQFDMSGGASITDTFDEVSLFSSVSGSTLSMGIWNASDGGTGAEIFLYTGAAGLAHTRLRATDGGAGNGNFLDVPNSGVLFTSNASTGGLILCTDAAAAPIIFAAGDNAFANEKGRFDAAGFTLGHVSTITGALNLANSASAFLTTITAGNAAAARTYVWPTNFGASGSVLTDAAGNGTLSWVVPAAGGMAIGGTVTSGTAGSVLFVNAGPILAQDNANFFWDDTNNRLGLGTATPAKLLHVNGIAQLGTVSATTGQLQLANSASANLTTIQAGNAAAAITYTWPLNVGASGAVLTDAAGNGTLSWAVPAAAVMAIGGTVTSGTTGSVLFVGAGPILAQDNANFFWDDSNNRLGIGGASPIDRLDVVTAATTSGNAMFIVRSGTATASTVSTRPFLTNSGADIAFNRTFDGTNDNRSNISNDAFRIQYDPASTSLNMQYVASGGNPIIWSTAQTFLDNGRIGVNGSPLDLFDITTAATTSGKAMFIVRSGTATSSHFSSRPFSSNNGADVAFNRTFDGTNDNRSNTSNDAFRIQYSPGSNSLSFQYAASGANPITWSTAQTILDTGLVGINKSSSIGAQLHIVSGGTTTIANRIDSATNTTVDLLQYNLSADDTATVANLATFQTNSNGTAAAGFGSSLTFNLESSTTNDRNAARLQWLWTDATDATRTADIVFQNVHLAAALATTFTIRSNGYYLWLGAKRVSTQFDKTNETLADITGLSVNVAAGRTYTFQATLYTTSDVAGGVKFAIAGTATATAIAYEAVDCQGGLTVATGTQRAAALATAVGDITAVTTAYVRITGTITVNAAGTLTVQSARNAAVGTTSVLVGSVFIVNEIS